MPRTGARQVAPQIVALWVVELGFAFLVVCALAGPEALGDLNNPLSAMDPRLLKRAAFLSGMLGGSAGAIGLYRPDVWLDPRRVAMHALIVAALTFPAALFVGTFFYTGGLWPYAEWLAEVMILWIAVVSLFRCALRTACAGLLAPRKLLIAGDPDSVPRLAAALRSRPGMTYELAGKIADDTAIPSVRDLRNAGIWALIVGRSPSNEQTAALIEHRLHGFPVFDEPGFSEAMLGRVHLDGLAPGWFLAPGGFATGTLGTAAKRTLDVVVGLLLLLLSLPVAAIVALAIQIDSRGPVFYRQERVGQDGRVFTLLKFRSMRVDAEAAGSPQWAERRDPRVTRVGAFIRSTRIDELPQLLNVIRGDMSLVGPRPERPHFVAQLSRAIPFYDQRACIRPGITGWAQINYPYGASIEDAREKLAYDLYYVKHRGFLLDLMILAATVRVILFREGAR